MKKITSLLLLVTFSFAIHAQKIKFFDSFLKQSDKATRYVVVLEDNSIWWYAPDNPWKKSSVEGLPYHYKIKHFAAFSKPDGNTRYVAVLDDNSIWWYAAESGTWKMSSTEGLPEGYSIRQFKAFTKEEGTRYVVVLDDGSIYWYAPDNPWKKTSLDGLPK